VRRIFTSLSLACVPFVLGALAPASTATAQPASGFDDHGTFILFVVGHKIGSEQFQIRPSQSDVRASAVVQLALNQEGKTLKFRTFPNLVLDSRLDPLTYAWEQKGAESSSIHIDFRRHPAQVHYRAVNGHKDYREFYLQPGVVILDDNVVDQYELLAWRYFMDGGKTQVFSAFIPQEGMPGRVQVRRLADGTIDAAGQHTLCRHLVVTTTQAQIDLWLDSAGRLLRMDKPSSQFTAIRQ
jgi:hypothetical protein